jgi:glycosyltransferase involved in cell wall biosynthesis
VISVIIPAFDEEKYLGRTLDAINNSLSSVTTENTDWEIIVCDNNSKDKTSDIASRRGVKVVFVEENQISLARNCGVKIARGDWLLFVDADTFPDRELMLETYDITVAGEYIGCGATVSVENGTLFNRLRIERLNPLFRLLNLCGGYYILCKADAFHAIGGFSTDLYALEDIDFVLRLKRYGQSVGKKFKILHRHPVTTSGRKGEYGIDSMLNLFASNILAIVLLGVHYISPRGTVKSVGKKLLGYWYNGKR